LDLDLSYKVKEEEEKKMAQEPLIAVLAGEYQNIQVLTNTNKNISIQSQRSSLLKDNIYDVDSNSDNEEESENKLQTRKSRRKRAYTQSNMDNEQLKREKAKREKKPAVTLEN
jgi:hypothetical protein